MPLPVMVTVPCSAGVLRKMIEMSSPSGSTSLSRTCERDRARSLRDVIAECIGRGVRRVVAAADVDRHGRRVVSAMPVGDRVGEGVDPTWYREGVVGQTGPAAGDRDGALGPVGLAGDGRACRRRRPCRRPGQAARWPPRSSSTGKSSSSATGLVVDGVDRDRHGGRVRAAVLRPSRRIGEAVGAVVVLVRVVVGPSRSDGRAVGRIGQVRDRETVPSSMSLSLPRTSMSIDPSSPPYAVSPAATGRSLVGIEVTVTVAELLSPPWPSSPR